MCVDVSMCPWSSSSYTHLLILLKHKNINLILVNSWQLHATITFFKKENGCKILNLLWTLLSYMGLKLFAQDQAEHTPQQMSLGKIDPVCWQASGVILDKFLASHPDRIVLNWLLSCLSLSICWTFIETFSKIQFWYDFGWMFLLEKPFLSRF